MDEVMYGRETHSWSLCSDGSLEVGKRPDSKYLRLGGPNKVSVA